MTRFLIRRAGLGLITLWLLSVGVFLGAQVLPGNPARAILGQDAAPAAVAQLNSQLGYDRPLLERYFDWLGGVLTGDFGTSYLYQSSAGDLIATALGNSLKLGLFAVVLIVPLSLAGGVFAALHRGRFADKAITFGGMVVSVLPEFVTGIVLLLVLGIWWPVLPITATAPAGAGPLEELKYLVLPALALMAGLFGYIARVARAGTIEVLDADSTRTATVKGLPRRQVIRRHVLRNALLPSITVTATQIGYMVGGLVVIERLFNYQGLGLLIFNAAQRKDFPLLQGAVLIVGALYIVLTLLADVVQAVVNPRVRAQVTGR
ncbi:ABC transporter permease [Conexibacter sp. CPCC 206217]|uniref:ABC transporter permease n=1 Tax=Conexibacter sp. CPCC 206217 TaxID=3064574 RepID=UPI00271F2E62|nr:ABC transporter permease [Conexibacter sp. CPCC 206217]MDO8210242.1 ABC transporter permease [Conexibacter sp. CPCC 206217]